MDFSDLPITKPFFTFEKIIYLCHAENRIFYVQIQCPMSWNIHFTSPMSNV